LNLQLLFKAVFLFAITNIDDILLLSLFFAGQDRRGISNIVLGQYLGFSALMAMSLCIGIAGTVVPVRWIALLGLVPVYLGVREYFKLWRSGKNGEGPGPIVPKRELLTVAGVTIANGADNLAVYGPTFAKVGWHGKLAISAIFYVMVAVWCVIGWLALLHPAISQKVTAKTRFIIPAALIIVGVVILAGLA
jgi:cadmium resistance protein CadD (predicted permease)